MGGGHKFFDVEFVLKNWQLHEVVETQTPEPLPMVDEDFSDY
jgi:hypothetical protein